jgi:FdrA protein
MLSASTILRNFYQDSVTLMHLSSRLAKLLGIVQASAVMVSASNLALLREAKMLAAGVDAGPNDLLVVLEGHSEAALANTLSEAQSSLDQKAVARNAKAKVEAPRSLEMGVETPRADGHGPGLRRHHQRRPGIRRGAIRAVAASGAGLQQVTCLVDRLGAGVSQAIGTGGHDLSHEVGGITMLQGIEALAADRAARRTPSPTQR